MNRSVEPRPTAPPPPHHFYLASGVVQSAAIGLSRSCDSIPSYPAPTSPLLGNNVLFSDVVNTVCRQGSREEIEKPLGILVTTGLSGPNSLAHCIQIRITDPTDYYFLYTMKLLEDDYSNFKMSRKITVDFAEFPTHLAKLLQDVLEGDCERKLVLSVDSNGTAKLSFQQKTPMLLVDVLVLEMTKQGDVGQKQYLAEQYDYYMKLFYRADADRKEEREGLGGTVVQLKAALADVSRERDELREKLMIDASEWEAKLQRSLSQQKDEHNSALAALRRSTDDERQSLLAKVSQTQRTLDELSKAKESQITELSTRVAQLTSSEAALTSQVELRDAKLSSLRDQFEVLQREAKELSQFRSQAQSAMNRGDLQSVEMSTRLRSAESQLEERKEETKLLRQQLERSDDTVRLLNDQLSKVQAQVAELDNDLQKAHHIIGNQLRATKHQKDKAGALAAQLADAQVTKDHHVLKIQELERKMAQGQGDNDKLRQALEELKAQHEKVVQANIVLTDNLKTTNDALVRLQVSHSKYPIMRPHGQESFASTRGISDGGQPRDALRPASLPDLMRNFSENASVPSSGITNVSSQNVLATGPAVVGKLSESTFLPRGALYNNAFLNEVKAQALTSGCNSLSAAPVDESAYFKK